MSHSNFVSLLSPLFYRMGRHFLLDDPDTKKVPGVAECSPLPLSETNVITAFNRELRCGDSYISKEKCGCLHGN